MADKNKHLDHLEDRLFIDGKEGAKEAIEIFEKHTGIDFLNVVKDGIPLNVVEGENGTGKSLRKEGYIIGGKTGTSRTHLEGVGYSEDRFNTSFTGFVETKEGPIVGAVLLWGAKTNPTSEYVTGGSTAAPIFKKIISYFAPKE